jgi:CRISPR-associated protein Cas2
MKFYIVCYDSPNNKRRRRIAKCCEDYLSRVQKSVFEGMLPANHFQKMSFKLKKEIDPDEDKLRIYTLTSALLNNVTIIGEPELNKIPLFYLVS